MADQPKYIAGVSEQYAGDYHLTPGTARGINHALSSMRGSIPDLFTLR